MSEIIENGTDYLTASRNAWATVVVDENSLLQALVLMKSLRRAMTTADIVVLVCNNLPKSYWSILCETFDSVIYFDRHHEHIESISALDEGKIHAWTLTMFQKCVVVDPTILILKNCDEMFLSPPFSTLCSVDSSVIIINPSLDVYNKIMDIIQTPSYGKHDSTTCVFRILKHIFGVTINSLEPDEYCYNKPGHYTNTGKIWNSSTDKPWQYLVKGNGHKLHGVVTNWLSVYECDVLPCLIRHKNKFQVEVEGISLIPFTQNGSFHNPLKEGITKSYHNEIKDSIAIVGRSCRLPGANHIEEFWNLLETGYDGISSISLDRLPEHLRNDSRYTSIKAGFLKCPIDEFDAKFFGISPREAAYTDPQQRLMLEVAWEALEDAAINPQTLKGSNTGIFSGVWTNDYESLVKENTPGKDFHHVVLGNAFSATSARVSYFLGLNGPNVATESGCSSSMVALHLACDSLRKRGTNLALATGVNLLICPSPHTDVAILAKDGHCKTFDEKADGFARAEGVVVIVLKRLSDALRDGDRIYSIVRGSALSSEGTTSSFGTPSKYCQEIAIKDALRVAGVEPEDVDYVEAHGTGTPVGDPIEIAAISAGYKAHREKPLIVGSVKTNTGHTESAAGLTGLVKVLLALENELIPPHRNLTSLNPNIDLESLPAVIPINPIAWKKHPEKRRLAGVSSFGISGTNVHVIIEEPPEIPDSHYYLKTTHPERTHHLLTLSAKTENALKDLSLNYYAHLNKYPELTCQNVCFTANTGRQHMKNRIAIVTKDLDDLKQKLSSPVFQRETLINQERKIVFFFTGQGSQYPGMAKTLYETSPVFQKAFNTCNEILINNTGISLLDELWSKGEENPTLDETICSQAAIFCVQYSLLKLWENLGIKPDYVLGHSVGEFAASVAAGIMTLNDALLLVAERSRLIHNLKRGGMLAVRCNQETAESMIKSVLENSDDWLDIAVINSPHELVIAGKHPILKRFSKLCEAENIKTQLLAARHAFHSRDMDAISDEFETFAKRFNYKSPTCKYVSGSTGKLLNVPGIINEKYWKNHLRFTVDFTKGMKLIHEHGCNIFIEIGAHPILLAIGMSNLPEPQNCIWLPSLRRNEENWHTMLQSVSKLFINGVDIDWEALDSGYVRKKVDLPHYPFQRQKYWIESKSEPLTKALHPLLGRKVALAASKDKVFQNILDLNEFSFIKDHQVANVIVFPGAGFLEIILAAGKQVLNESHEIDVVITDFLIEAPMELLENKVVKIQVVVSKNEVDNHNDNLFVRIFLHSTLNGYNDEKDWKLIASGNVTRNKDLHSLSFPQKDFENIKSRCVDEIPTEEFYRKTEEIGIKFGETFQSISRIFTGEKSVIVEIPCPKNVGSMEEYIYHPIVLDAMIQAFDVSTGQLNSDLHLPIGIKNFVTISKCLNSSRFFAYVDIDEKRPDVAVYLYDEKFNVLCIMEGIRFVKTSISSFLNVINSRKSILPGIYEVTWRNRYSILQSRIDLHSQSNFDLNDVNVAMKEFMHMNTDIEHARNFTDIHSRFTILITFSKLGWKPQVGNRFSTKSFIQDLLLTSSQTLFIERLLSILVEDRFLDVEMNKNSKEWIVLQTLPPLNEMIKMRKEIYEQYKILNCIFVELNLYLHCCDNLADILQNKITGVSFLFGNENADLNPSIIYNKGHAVKLANLRAMFYLQFKFANSIQTKNVVRILEIGGGSGATSNEILTGLKNQGIPYRYTFTDISPFFLQEAKHKFKEYSGVEYKILNIEKDPKYQGFVPHSFDVVVAANVIHATEYLTNSLKNVRQLLAPKGILILQEMLAPLRSADMIYGMIEGYWLYKDFNLRNSHPCVSQEVWSKLLSENGFSSVLNISHEKEFMVDLVAEAADLNPQYSTIMPLLEEKQHKVSKWIIFSIEDNRVDFINNLTSLIQNSGDGVIVVNHSVSSYGFANDSCVFADYTGKEGMHKILAIIKHKFDVKGIIILAAFGDSNNQAFICRPTLYIAQYLSLNRIKDCKIVTVTNGAYFIGDQREGHPSQATVAGFMRSFFSECPDINGILLDLDPDSVDFDTNSSQIIFSEIWNTDKENIVAYRGSKKFILRFTSYSSPQTSLMLPNGRYKIVLPKSKKIEDVSFTTTNHAQLLSNQVEIAVKTFALNFRDIFVITKPHTFKTRFEDVGTDFAGIVTNVGNNVLKFKVGDEVFGISQCSSAASHIVATCEQLTHKPKHFTFLEACTLPSVYLTAYYGLVTIAGLKCGETILIHVASGGVGLAAIQIAQDIGAKIIATAGSERKRAHLRFIGIEHVFHSRNLHFGADISKVTNGKGVDVVLNSLTGHGFKETSLNICAQNARFVEMGKVNIWQSNDVAKLRPDVRYTIIDLETMKGEDMEMLTTVMAANIASKKLKPLPYTMFVLSELKSALAYFQKSQHIGKIVVKMPQLKETLGRSVANDFLFNENGTYLITGGFGGIGLEVAKWMDKCGARNIVLVGRSAPDENAQRMIKRMRDKGCQIMPYLCDIGDWEHCKILFGKIQSGTSPLRGVIHSAGVLHDGMIANQTWEKFETVFNAKVNGGWNLHHLTKDLALEHFVLFSSIASLIGPLGQSSHSCANTFLDGLAHYRHSLGLPAQTINWGAWSDIGAAINTEVGKKGAFGVKPFTPAQGIAALKFCMTQPVVQMGVVDLDENELIASFPSHANTFSELHGTNKVIVPTSSVQSDSFFKEIEILTEEEKNIFIQTCIKSIIRQILKLPDSEVIDEYQTFSEMGLDSLMAVEMRNKLQTFLGKRLMLNPTSLLDYPNLSSLTKYLLTLIRQLNTEISSDFEKGNLELISQDSILPSYITKVSGGVVLPSQCKYILLTGVTGRLGVHLLSEFNKNSGVHIICLMRDKTVQGAIKRLEKCKNKFKVNTVLNNVTIVLGDISEDFLGMDKSEYVKWAKTIDSIFHAAVKANHIEKYKKSLSKKDIRSVNVIGTLEILKFAAAYKTKRVFSASSFSAATHFGDDGFISDELPEEGDVGEGIDLGYAMTKFVAEKLMSQALKRGIPCTVLRFPSFIGHSETGHFTTDANMVMNILLSALRFKVFRNIPGGWYIMPVDIAAKISAEIFFNDNADLGLYNVVNSVPLTSNEFVSAAKEVGFEINVVDAPEFTKKVFAEGNPLTNIFKETFGDSDPFERIIAISPVSRSSLTEEKKVFKVSAKLRKAVTDIDTLIPSPSESMYRQLKFAKDERILQV